MVCRCRHEPAAHHHHPVGPPRKPEILARALAGAERFIFTDIRDISNGKSHRTAAARGGVARLGSPRLPRLSWQRALEVLSALPASPCRARNDRYVSPHYLRNLLSGVLERAQSWVSTDNVCRDGVNDG